MSNGRKLRVKQVCARRLVEKEIFKVEGRDQARQGRILGALNLVFFIAVTREQKYAVTFNRGLKGFLPFD